MENIERRDIMSTVDLPEGKVNILGGAHDRPQEFPDGCENFVKDTDLIFLEGSQFNTAKYDEFMDSAEKKDVQYKELIKVAKQNGKILYFPDLNFELPTGLGQFEFEAKAPTIEALIGLGLAISNSRAPKVDKSDVNMQVNQGRRKFLKILASTWLIAPLASEIIGNMMYDSGAKREGMKVEHVVNKMHPELYNYMLTVRNIVFAYKILYGLRNVQVNNQADDKPTASIVVGALHLDGLEEIFSKYQKGEITFEQIEEAYLKIRDSYGDKVNNTDLIGAVQFDQDAQKWQNRTFNIKFKSQKDR